MLGAEQSGFIADLGYETYQKVLGEAMRELKKETRELPPDASDARAVDVESDIPAFFAETFVPSSSERVSLYRELDSLTSQRQLDDYRRRLIDRFGNLPSEAEELLRIMPLKWVAARLSISRLTLKQHRLIAYLPADSDSPFYQSDTFGHLIHYAAQHPRECQLRDVDPRTNRMLRSILIRPVDTVEQALQILSDME